ncbi:MAG TPA: type II toxin-antitoxin system VapC family toxin [Bryobacteraceae bacterium]|nr:type II toxin-antitoxin system VapC family toxin [Bryobacteraceae bacterium]
MILVDSNIFMYAAGSAHPHKQAAIAFLEGVAEGSTDAGIDAEVLQEILHRYRALRRWPEGGAVYDAARILFQDVLPITGEVLDCARWMLEKHSGVGARDALHAAVVEVYRLDGICSFDQDFDVIQGLRRLEP